MTESPSESNHGRSCFARTSNSIRSFLRWASNSSWTSVSRSRMHSTHGLPLPPPLRLRCRQRRQASGHLQCHCRSDLRSRVPCRSQGVGGSTLGFLRNPIMSNSRTAPLRGGSGLLAPNVVTWLHLPEHPCHPRVTKTAKGGDGRTIGKHKNSGSIDDTAKRELPQATPEHL